MFCSNCGKEIPNDSTFCPFCGEKVVAAQAQASSYVAHEPQATLAATQEKGVSLGMNIFVIIATVFIPLVGLIMGPVYMKNSNPAKKKVGKIWLGVGIIAFLFNMMLYLSGEY